MRTINYYFGAVALCLGLSSAAAAGDTYRALSLGNALYDIDFPGNEHGYDVEHAQSLSLLVGRRYGPFAIELEYTHLGTFSIQNSAHQTSATIQTVSIAAVPRLGGRSS